MDAKKVPTLEEWIMESFPGANLDNLQISARVVVQIAQSYADVQAASLRSRNSELVERIKKLADAAQIVLNHYQHDPDLHTTGARIVLRGEIKAARESLLPPDPATTNSKENTRD